MENNVIAQPNIISLNIEKNQILKFVIDDRDLLPIGNYTYHFYVQEFAQLDIFFIGLNSQSIQFEIYIHLQGHHAQANMRGFCVLSQDQQLSMKTYQVHEGQNTKSEVMLRGLLKDHSRMMHEGLIRINQTAKYADAGQEIKNILLSKTAFVKSIPSIEVLQHEVQCGHGTATSKFDQKQLWYLQSKGFELKKSYELLIHSFVGPMLSQSAEENKLMELVCQKMI